MNRLPNNQFGLHIISVSASVLFFFVASGGFAGDNDSLVQKKTRQDADAMAQKVNLREGIKALSEGRPSSSDGKLASVPSDAIFATMDANERCSFARAAAKLCDRFEGGAALSDTEIVWMKRGLPFLRMSEGGQEERVLVERVYREAVGSAGNLVQLRQAEVFARAVYSEMAANGKAETGGFDRTRLKKDLIRRRLAMLKGGTP